MRVLVTGASGFIGSALVRALHQEGHQPICCLHRDGVSTLPKGATYVYVDYMGDLDAADWIPRLRGIDVVVNAVGILRERPGASFAALHHLAPRALFDACERAAVRRVIQISALGADDAAVSAYHRSKKAGDDALRTRDLNWTIVQPSLVFGMGGASTRLFLALASLPVVPLVGRGESPLQPIHIDDLVALILRLIETGAAARQVVAAVGAAPISFRMMLTTYRNALGWRSTPVLRVPLLPMRLLARVGDLLGRGALTTETLGMLLRGNIASSDTVTCLLGRSPRAPDAFITAVSVAALRVHAVWTWVRPFLVVALAAMWIAAGLLSGLYARNYGVALLQGLGLPETVAIAALVAACGVDVALGLAALIAPGRRVWMAQLGVMAFYSAALTVVAPQLWAEPFGPLVKNLPLAAVLLGLAMVER